MTEILESTAAVLTPLHNLNVSTDAPKLTREEFQEAHSAIQRNNDSTWEYLLYVHNREGWHHAEVIDPDTNRMRKCSSWEEFLGTLGISKRHAYRIMQTVKVRQLLQDASVPLSQAEQLARLPEEEIPKVYEQVSSSGNVTEKSVRKAVEKALPKPATPNRKLSPEPGFPDAHNDEVLWNAIQRIKEATGNKHVEKAIIKGDLNLDRKEVLLWGSQKSVDTIKAIERLVATGWTVNRAIQFLSEMLDSKARIESLLNLCIAHGGKVEVSIDGIDIVATLRKQRR